jgi:PIN domain nuclease of toxin-antitoxin system
MGELNRAPLLLDTHILLWALTDPDRLPTAVAQRITDRSQPICVSAASAWEIALKFRSGKLPDAERLIRHYDRNLTTLSADSLPITSAHSLAAGTLEWSHRDPFDRMIAAQCLFEGLTLASVDPIFSVVAGLSLLR